MIRTYTIRTSQRFRRNKTLKKRLRFLAVLAVFQFLLVTDPFLTTLTNSLFPTIRQNRIRRLARTMPLNGEPSHIRMCRQLLPRLDHAMVIDAAEKQAESLGLKGVNLANIPELQIPEREEWEYLLVEEDERVCRTESVPTESLLQMFSSALLSAAASQFKLNVEYQHNCYQWRERDNSKREAMEENQEQFAESLLTIQEMMPKDLLDNEETEKIPLEVLAIKNICVGCIAEFDANNGTASTRNCALFTRPTVYTPLALFGKKKRRQRIKRGRYTITRSISIFNSNSMGGDGNSLTNEDEEEYEEEDEEYDTTEDTTEDTTSSFQQQSQHGFESAQRRTTTFHQQPQHGFESVQRRATSEEGNKAQLPTGIVSILPTIKANLQKISITWTESLGSTYITDRLTNRPGAHVTPMAKISEIPSIASTGEKGAYSQASNDAAVIYLTCKKENCAQPEFTDALVMPLYVYVTEIPSSVASITVMVSKECNTFVPDCAPHGRALTALLDQFYPRATVEFLIEESTYAAFARMTTANYLLCPPGLGCMLPALGTTGHSTQVGNPNLVHWLPQLTITNIWNIKFLAMTEVPVMSVKELDFDPFLRKIPAGKIGLCRQLRGRLGRWTRDMALAPSMQYVTPIRHYVGEADLRFEPSDELPFRRSSTFRWEEEIFPTCGAQMMTIENLCFALAEIDIDRIFLVGDSSSMNHAQSLWKLLGNEDNPNVLGVRDPNWDRVIDCPEEDRTITISYARNDQLIENNKPVDIAQDLRNCYAYCYPWEERYTDFAGSTLLIVNTGAHYQTHHQFQYALREFIKRIDSLERFWDIMLYRTSSPGHSDCEERPETPFASYDEYTNTITDEYSWEKFVGYNDYAIKFIDERNRGDSRGYKSGGAAVSPVGEVGILAQPDRMKMEVLDVYPTTVLRRDGHVSGEECEGCQSHAIRDCMHYFLPGPVDWWNHLLFSYIMDFGRRE